MVKRKRKPRKHGARYPWVIWFSQIKLHPVTLVKGRHYNCLQHGMVQSIRKAAKRAGIRLSLRVGDHKIIMEYRNAA